MVINLIYHKIMLKKGQIETSYINLIKYPKLYYIIQYIKTILKIGNTY